MDDIEIPDLKTLGFATEHVNMKSGFIVLNFAEINNEMVLAFANHGVRMTGESSVNKIRQVFHRLEKIQ